MSLTQPSLLGTVFFQTALPCSGGFHMERRWMSLHDAVGINCKKDASSENQDSAVKYKGSGVFLDDCVCVLPDLTWLPLLGVGRKSWYIIFKYCDIGLLWSKITIFIIEITLKLLLHTKYGWNNPNWGRSGLKSPKFYFFAISGSSKFIVYTNIQIHVTSFVYTNILAACHVPNFHCKLIFFKCW